MTLPPTAILCHTDYLAAFIYQALHSLGARIPRDVAVMGCSGCKGETLLEPPLTTVAFDYGRQGEEAVRLLTERGRWFGVPGVAAPLVCAPHTLIENKSTDVIHIK